jgi:transcriptional regulator with XRE-family HTH domain
MGDIFMKLRLRDIREDQDLTQRQIAEYLMCDQSLYSKYEREEREIPLRLLTMLARYYHVSLDYLAGLTNEKTPYPRKRE